MSIFSKPKNLVWPIVNSSKYRDIKDPCPVFDGNVWHVYGSGGSSQVEVWEILHVTASSPDGPWSEPEPARLHGSFGERMAAPGVVFDYDQKLFHMFIQSDFMSLDTTVEHFISDDGVEFDHIATILHSLPGTEEAGIYDPHPAEIQGKKYITYSGCPEMGKPDLYLAQSTSGSWYGPWERVGKILSHEEVPFHNQRGSEGYEWGLEGSQLAQLPNGKVVLIAVCFMAENKPGTKQRVFLASSEKVEGPYIPTEPLLEPNQHGLTSGENGHAAVAFYNNSLYLYFQARTALEDSTQNVWRYGYATYELSDLS